MHSRVVARDEWQWLQATSLSQGLWSSRCCCQVVVAMEVLGQLQWRWQWLVLARQLQPVHVACSQLGTSSGCGGGSSSSSGRSLVLAMQTVDMTILTNCVWCALRLMSIWCWWYGCQQFHQVLV